MRVFTMSLLCLPLSASLCLWLSPVEAKAVLQKRWRPRAIGGTDDGGSMRRYALAQLHLETQRRNSSALLDEDGNLFLVTQEADGDTMLESVMWNNGAYRRRCDIFARLREWHASRCPGASLVGDALREEEDRTAWYESGEEG